MQLMSSQAKNFPQKSGAAVICMRLAIEKGKHNYINSGVNEDIEPYLDRACVFCCRVSMSKRRMRRMEK